MAIVNNTEPVSGHGVEFGVTLDPGAAPGDFTRIGYITSDLPFNTTSPTTVFTPHDKGISYVVVGPEQHEEWTFTAPYVSADPTHDFLREARQDRTFLGFQWAFGTGMGSDQGVIASGYVSAWGLSQPNTEGTRDMNVTIVRSGPYWVDGTLVGDSF